MVLSAASARNEPVRSAGRPRTSWIVAEVDGVRVGFAADVVEEIRPFSRLGVVPCAPAHLMGLTLVRGEPVAVVDLGRFLGLSALSVEANDDTRPPRVVTVATGGYRVGLAVARVVGVRRGAPEELSPPDIGQGGRGLDLTLGELHAEVGMVSVLDLDRLLFEARVRAA